MHLDDIKIRTHLLPGDIGYITYLHGFFYARDHGFGIPFETYVAEGLTEFYENYDAEKDGIWVCEHNNKIVGFLVLMHRGNAAQLRYFILDPGYRGIGLGKKLMGLFMDHFKKCRYESAYLWTTHELGTAAYLYTSRGFRLTEERESNAFGKLLIEQRYDFFVNEP